MGGRERGAVKVWLIPVKHVQFPKRLGPGDILDGSRWGDIVVVRSPERAWKIEGILPSYRGMQEIRVAAA
jgi:hypothetical protein